MTKRNEIVDGRLTYQYGKLQAALEWVKNWRTAIDVGAHCGLWSMHLVKHFSMLHAFEPVAQHRACFAANLRLPYEQRPDVDYSAAIPDIYLPPVPCALQPFALGERDGKVSIHTAPISSGDSWVDGEGDIPMRRLDDFGFKDVDFIKLDCEGYEFFALRGGEETLKRCRPCVIVEQKPGRAQKFGLPETGAVDYLVGLGAKLRREMSGDFILSWD